MSPLTTSVLHVAAAGAAVTAGWLALWHYAPAAPQVIYSMLTKHPWLTGVWLMLAIVGVDYALVAARDTVSYRGVGSKAAAHWHQQDSK